MAAITYGAHAPVEQAVKRETALKKSKGFWTRFFEAIVEARMKQAEREIALHRHLLPDEFEIAGYKITPKSEDSLPFVR